jgi:hypothetical protein
MHELNHERQDHRLLPLLVIAAGLMFSGPSHSAPLSPEEATALLSQSDLGNLCPAELRTEVRITREGDDKKPDSSKIKTVRLELWRKGPALSLLRFLDPGERGKYLLRRDGKTLFLAPGSKRAIPLGRRHKLHGSATLDDLLGVRFSQDHVLEGHVVEDQPDGTQRVVFTLRVGKTKGKHARVKYVVDPSTARPTKIERYLRSGKLASVLEIVEWEAGEVLLLKRLRIRDALRGESITKVSFSRTQVGGVPEAIFEPENHAARSALPEPSKVSAP